MIKLSKRKDIFSANTQEKVLYCLSRAYIDHAYWLYYDASSFVSELSLAQKITYRDQILNRFDQAISLINKSKDYWVNLDKDYSSTFKKFTNDLTKIIETEKIDACRTNEYDEDIKLSKLLSDFRNELSASSNFLDILPIDHLDCLFGEVNKATAFLFEDILMGFNTDDFESLNDQMTENFYVLDECLSILNKGYEKYLSKNYFQYECLTILMHSKSDLKTFDEGTVLFKFNEDIKLLFAAWHHFVFMLMLMTKNIFEEDDEINMRVDLTVREGIPEAIDAINYLGFSMSKKLLSYLSPIKYHESLAQSENVRFKIKQTFSYKKFFRGKTKIINS